MFTVYPLVLPKYPRHFVNMEKVRWNHRLLGERRRTMKTLFEKLEHRRGKYFVGRQKEKKIFKKLLKTSHLDYNILVIYGPGGRGKSWLLDELRDICHERKTLAGHVSIEEKGSVVDILSEFRAQIDPRQRWWSSFREFDNLLNRWWLAQAKLRRPEKVVKGRERLATKVTSGLIKEVAEVAVQGAIGSVVGGAIAGPIGIGIGAITSLALEGLQSTVQTLLERGLTIEEARLILTILDALMTKFVETVNKLAHVQRIILMFDSFEHRSPELDTWIRTKFLPLLNPDKIVVIIAGHDRLDRREWYKPYFVLHQIELEAFNFLETKRYLRLRGISAGPEQERIYRKTKGLPLGVAVWADVRIRDNKTSSIPEANAATDVTTVIVEWLLQGISKELGDTIRVCSVPRILNEEIITTLFGERLSLQLFDQLLGYGSLFRTCAEGLSMHEDVRPFFVTNLRWRTPERYRAIHECMATYYNRKLQELEAKRGIFDAIWKIVLIEKLYHEFVLSLERGLHELDHRIEVLRTTYHLSLAKSIISEVEKFLTDLELPKALRLWLDYYKGLLFYDEGDWLKVKQQFAHVLDVIDEDNSALKSRVLSDLGILYFNQGSIEKAENCYRKCRMIMEQLQDEVSLARVVAYLGANIYRIKGDLDKALNLYMESLSLFRKQSDNFGIGRVSLDIGNIYRLRGRFSEALKYCQDSLNIFNKLGNDYERGRALYTIGRVLMSQGLLDPALNYHLQALELLRAVNAPFGIGIALRNIGDVYRLQRCLQDAFKAYNASLNIFSKLGMEMEVARVQGDLGTLHVDMGDITKAKEYYAQCMELKEKLGDEYGIGITSYYLGKLYFGQGMWHKAREKFNKSLEIMNKYGNSQKQGEILIELCKLDMHEDESLFQQHLRQAISLAGEYVFHDQLAELNYLNGILLIKVSKFIEAYHAFGAALINAARHSASKLEAIFAKIKNTIQSLADDLIVLPQMTELSRYLISFLQEQEFGISHPAIVISLEEIQRDLVNKAITLRQSKLTKVLSEVDQIMEQATQKKVFPGAAVWVAWCNETIKCSAYGQTADRKYDTYSPMLVTTKTLYDLASLTKVVATTPAIIHLVDQRQLRFEDPVSKYIPKFGTDPQKASVTIWHLLTHTSGLPVHVKLYEHYRGRDKMLEAICQQNLLFQPGTQYLYSDLGFALLGEVVSAISLLKLNEYAHRYLFEPLAMKDTMFNPPKEVLGRIAPTEYVKWRGGLVHGQVHDANAWAMDGVAGHAGLFSTVEDLARFCKMLLGFGEYSSKRVLKINSVVAMTSQQNIGPIQSCGLSWMQNISHFMGKLANNDTFGHTGFTGTSIVINPRQGLAIILLSNRVCPTRDGPEITPYRQRLADVLAEL